MSFAMVFDGLNQSLNWNFWGSVQLNVCWSLTSLVQLRVPASTEVDPSTPLQESLAGLAWSEWEEADLFPVIRYCRGSTRLAIPDEWRQFDHLIRSRG